MNKFRLTLLAAMIAVACLAGCDGQDPERLNRVGKKLAEKGRKTADDANLPKVSVSYPAGDASRKAAAEGERSN